MEIGWRLLELGWRCCTRDRRGETKSEETVRTKTSEDSQGSKHNIQTSVECCDKVYVYLFSYQLQKRKELTKEEGIYSSKVNECMAAHISYVGVRLRYLIYD